jgi:hypothetical protein
VCVGMCVCLWCMCGCFGGVWMVVVVCGWGLMLGDFGVSC